MCQYDTAEDDNNVFNQQCIRGSFVLECNNGRYLRTWASCVLHYCFPPCRLPVRKCSNPERDGLDFVTSVIWSSLLFQFLPAQAPSSLARFPIILGTIVPAHRSQPPLVHLLFTFSNPHSVLASPLPTHLHPWKWPSLFLRF